MSIADKKQVITKNNKLIADNVQKVYKAGQDSQQETIHALNKNIEELTTQNNEYKTELEDTVQAMSNVGVEGVTVSNTAEKVVDVYKSGQDSQAGIINELEKENAIIQSNMNTLITQNNVYYNEERETITEIQKIGVEVENVETASGLHPNISDAIPEVYDAGKSYQNNELWKAITNNGTRTNYSGAFRYQQWDKNNFLPTYDIAPADASMMFRSVDPGVDELQIDMEELEKKQGIRFDFSKCTNFDYAFAGGLFRTLNVIDMSSYVSGNYVFYAGYTGRKLNRINRLIFSEKTKPHSSWFGYCYDLTHIGFEGILAQNWADVSACKYLDKESITKLIGILSSSTSGFTITLSKKAVNTAFGIDIDDEATYPEGSEYYNLRNTKSNWTFNYV